MQNLHMTPKSLSSLINKYLSILYMDEKTKKDISGAMIAFYGSRYILVILKFTYALQLARRWHVWIGYRNHLQRNSEIQTQIHQNSRKSVFHLAIDRSVEKSIKASKNSGCLFCFVIFFFFHLSDCNRNSSNVLTFDVWKKFRLLSYHLTPYWRFR